MSNRENEDVLWHQTSFWEGKIRLKGGKGGEKGGEALRGEDQVVWGGEERQGLTN